MPNFDFKYANILQIQINLLYALLILNFVDYYSNVLFKKIEILIAFTKIHISIVYIKIRTY